jgi:hypothetical protein
LNKGVPVSSQWYKDGHIYPIQVAQFGLSHFSKWVNTKEIGPIQKILVNNDSKFIYHKNDLNFVKPLANGFEFNFPGLEYSQFYKIIYF